MLNMLNIFWDLSAFILALGILITVHEFGHFWVARCCGVHVERFSIGFGKILYRRMDRHGTEFVISLIPFGGYVKMLDTGIDPVIISARKYCSFNQKTPSKRACIIFAGPMANFIFAIFVYWLVFIIGLPGIRPVIGEIIPNSISDHAQIVPGMELQSIDGIKTPDWDTVRLQLMSKIGDNQAKIIVSPFGSDQTHEKILNLQNWSFKPDEEDPLSSIGIYPCATQIETVLSKVQDQSPAQKAGLRAGDRIVKIDGKPLIQWMTFINLVRDNLGKPLVLEVERQGNIISLTLIPDIKPGGSKTNGFAGVVPKVIPLPDQYKVIHQYGPISAIVKSIEKTWQLMKLTVKMLGKLITGEIKLNNLSGPISIARGAGISAEFGIVYYLVFIALISINLGIINLVPLPVLDGGHLLFLIIEKIKGTPVSEQVQDMSYRIGSILLILLMVFALFNDFSRL